MELNSKIFVAGGSGLVGSAIINNLISKGYTNIVTNYLTRKPQLNAQSLTLNAKKLDLLDSQAVKEFFENESPEYVFLAAAKVGGIVANNTYRADFIYENLQIQNNIIHQSYKAGVKKLMFLGSTCIYPKNAPQPMPEECLLTDTLEYTNEPYAIAKIAGIKMCESYNLQYGTNYISVMPTNLYGPNDNFDLEKSHVLPALIRKIHLGKALESVKWEALSVKGDENWEVIKKDLSKLPIEGIDGNASKEEILEVLQKYGIKSLSAQSLTLNAPQVTIEIWGSGKPMREFLWSEDMADACVYLMENRNFSDIIRNVTQSTQSTIDGKSCESLNAQRSTLNTEVRNTHINIGTGVDISIKELAETIKEIVGFNGQLYFNADKPDGTMKKLTDVSKLHGLGWKHKVQLKEGIEKMYAWYKGK